MEANSTSLGDAVVISLEDLRNGTVPLSALENAFGPDSLGIIVVKDLPKLYKDLRHRLLSYSSYLANLPKEQLSRLESPESKYLVGWSLGKETLKSGQYDTLKGSYYVNCAPALQKDATIQKDVASRFPAFPEYTAPNIWPPSEVLPGFETAFNDLCNLIIDTAVLVARACDRYAEEKIDGYKQGYLEHIVQSSVSTKARLLHYFPQSPRPDDTQTPNGHPQKSPQDSKDEDDDDWCATHLDHSCLTGLTSAMFVDEAIHSPTVPEQHDSTTPPAVLSELPSSPDSDAGLYIHSRTGAVTKIAIPRDCLAFQTGEALEVITRGKFRAVPHFVKGAKAGGRVARNTLAVFTQPNLWEMVDENRDFAAFAREIVSRNH